MHLSCIYQIGSVSKAEFEWKKTTDLEITTSAVLDKDSFLNKQRSLQSGARKNNFGRIGEYVACHHMHLRVRMILDVMSTYGMLECCVWDPVETGGKSMKLWCSFPSCWIARDSFHHIDLATSTVLDTLTSPAYAPMLAPSALAERMASCNGIAARRKLSPWSASWSILPNRKLWA